MMNSVITTLLFVAATSAALHARAEVRWPRDVFEWQDRDKATEKAVEEEMAIAFIFVPSEWSDPKDPGVVLSIEATNDAIKDLKSWCVVVKGIAQALAQAEEGTVPEALLQGFGAAGMTYPLVVVLDGKMKKVLCATAGQKIHDEGGKIFREGKRTFRDLLKEEEEEGGE
jgi:hypothetical protein